MELYNGIFLLAGYALGLRFAQPEQLTVVKPLMDRITIVRYPFNRRRKLIRDEDGKPCTIEVKHEGRMKIEDDGSEEEAYVEIERKVRERSLKELAVRYDADSDILYISIKDEDVEDMDELGEDIFVEYNKGSLA